MPDGERVDLSVPQRMAAPRCASGTPAPGIPSAEHERGFDPFHCTLDSDQIGSGLGLSIVNPIVDRIGAEARFRTW